MTHEPDNHDRRKSTRWARQSWQTKMNSMSQTIMTHENELERSDTRVRSKCRGVCLRTEVVMTVGAWWDRNYKEFSNSIADQTKAEETVSRLSGSGRSRSFCNIYLSHSHDQDTGKKNKRISDGPQDRNWKRQDILDLFLNRHWLGIDSELRSSSPKTPHAPKVTYRWSETHKVE